MKTLARFFIAASVVSFASSLTGAGGEFLWGFLKPLSALLFGAFFISNLLAKEYARYDEEHEYRMGVARKRRGSSVPRTRMVNVTTRVDDASCTTRMDQTPLAGAVYLVQYEFMANGVCRATCQRLLSGADGSLVATACGAGEPPTTGSVPLASEWAAEDEAAAESGTTDDGSFVSGTSGGEATTSGN